MAHMPGRKVDDGIMQQDVVAAVSARGSRCAWLGEVGWEWGAWFSKGSRKSLVRMHMHDGCMNGIILDGFLLLSVVRGEHFLISEWK